MTNRGAMSIPEAAKIEAMARAMAKNHYRWRNDENMELWNGRQRIPETEDEWVDRCWGCWKEDAEAALRVLDAL